VLGDERAAGLGVGLVPAGQVALDEFGHGIFLSRMDDSTTILRAASGRVDYAPGNARP
jgi:hypothetical protein